MLMKHKTVSKLSISSDTSPENVRYNFQIYIYFLPITDNVTKFGIIFC